MDIGKEKEKIIVEPIIDPVPDRDPEPERHIDEPEPEREPVKTGHSGEVSWAKGSGAFPISDSYPGTCDFCDRPRMVVPVEGYMAHPDKACRDCWKVQGFVV